MFMVSLRAMKLTASGTVGAIVMTSKTSCLPSKTCEIASFSPRNIKHLQFTSYTIEAVVLRLQHTPRLA